jgi:hypothetical protein
LVPADRFFHAAPEVLKTLKQRVAANALELARHGMPKKPFYLTGQVEGKAFSVHREGERLILMRNGEQRQEIELAGPDGVKEEPLSSDAEEATSTDALPAPLCPDGSPTPAVGDPANGPPPAPGQCPLDESPLAREDDSTDSDLDSSLSEGGEES